MPDYLGSSYFYTVPVLECDVRSEVVCLLLTIFEVCPLAKLFESAIIDRFMSYLATSYNQFNFKKYLSCSHAIYAV